MCSACHSSPLGRDASYWKSLRVNSRRTNTDYLCRNQLLILLGGCWSSHISCHWMSHASSKHFPLTPRTPYSFWTATFDRLDNVCFLLLLNDSNQTPCAHKPLSLITPALALNSMNPQALSHIVLKQLVDPAAFHRISQRIGSNQSTILPPETARLSSKSLYIYIYLFIFMDLSRHPYLIHQNTQMNW